MHRRRRKDARRTRGVYSTNCIALSRNRTFSFFLSTTLVAIRRQIFPRTGASVRFGSIRFDSVCVIQRTTGAQRARVERAMNSSNGRPHGENRGRNGHVLVWEQPGLEEEDRPNEKSKYTSRVTEARLPTYVYLSVKFSFFYHFEAEFLPFRLFNSVPSRESRVESTCSIAPLSHSSSFSPLSILFPFRCSFNHARARARAQANTSSFKVCTSTRTTPLTPFRRFHRPLCVHSVFIQDHANIVQRIGAVSSGVARSKPIQFSVGSGVTAWA